MLIPTTWWASDSTKKLAVVRAVGARFASVRFVAGRLDPFASREEFLGKHRRGRMPRSRHSRDTSRIHNVQLPRGKLSVHEEFADAAVEAFAPVLRETFSNHVSRPRSASAYDQPTICLRKRLADA
jgi:hypothetical protein